MQWYRILKKMKKERLQSVSIVSGKKKTNKVKFGY